MLSGKPNRNEENNLTKNSKRTMVVFLNGFFVLMGLSIIFQLHMNVYSILVLLIIAPLISNIIIYRIIPDKKIKKKKTKPSNNISHNRLHSDEKILQLDLMDLSAYELERLCYLYNKAKGYRPELTKKRSRWWD